MLLHYKFKPDATARGTLVSFLVHLKPWVALETMQSMKSKLPTPIESGGFSFTTQLKAVGIFGIVVIELFQVSLYWEKLFHREDLYQVKLQMI